MHAVVTAGGTPRPNEPLYPLTQGRPKALLELHGRPLVQWVLDALCGARQVEQVVIVGLPPETRLPACRPLTILPDQGGMLENLRAGVNELERSDPGLTQVLAVSSDIPAITSEMVDWTIERVLESDHDAYYQMIPRAAMEARYPGSRRTFTHFKDLDFTGGDLNAVRADAVLGDRSIYHQVIHARKSPLRLASLIGVDTLLKLALGRLTVAEVEAIVWQRLGIRARVLRCPYPEIGMDVDKPGQLELLRADLQHRLPTL